MFARTCINTWRSHKSGCVFRSNQRHVRKILSMSTYTSLKTGEMSRDTTTSTIRPSKTQYKFLEYVEDLDGYCPGAYHPLQIGDDLRDGRYRLIDKLGYGEYSTIWLAHDLQRAKYAAVKVITADASAYTTEASLSFTLSWKLAVETRKSNYSIAHRRILGFRPNGNHRCIVIPPAQMSLFDAREASTFGLFRPKVAQSIIAQLIRGVAFLHSEDIVHGELYERFGEPEPEAVVCLDGTPLPNGVPANVFVPGWFGVRSDDIALGEEEIVLSDFGESFNPRKTSRFLSKTLPLLQPPEARFSDEPLSFASDIWTLACTIWEIFGQRPLLDAFWPTPDRVTAEQVEVLGTLPPEWWGNWHRRLEWFIEEGELDSKLNMSRGHDGVRRTWDRRFDYRIQAPRTESGLEVVTEEEKRAFEAMLRLMLTFRPKERVTAH